MQTVDLVAFFKKLFNYYFWLCWVFVAAHRLSLVVASGGYSLAVLYRLLAVASLVAELGLLCHLSLALKATAPDLGRGIAPLDHASGWPHLN